MDDGRRQKLWAVVNICRTGRIYCFFSSKYMVHKNVAKRNIKMGDCTGRGTGKINLLFSVFGLLVVFCPKLFSWSAISQTTRDQNRGWDVTLCRIDSFNQIPAGLFFAFLKDFYKQYRVNSETAFLL